MILPYPPDEEDSSDETEEMKMLETLKRKLDELTKAQDFKLDIIIKAIKRLSDNDERENETENLPPYK